MSRIAGHVAPGATPQSVPIFGREADMAKNEAGGYTFVIDDWKRLDRFLIVGSEGGTYYVSERKLTLENAKIVQRLVTQDGARTLARVVEVSTRGLAFKAEPAIFALAMCVAYGDKGVRANALAAIPLVCRTGTHLFQMVEAMKALDVKWGRSKRHAIARWYAAGDDKALADLAYGLIKYQSREGWSHRDLLRLAHVKAGTEAHNALLRWAAKGWTEEEAVKAAATENPALRRVVAFEALKASAGDVASAVKLIADYDLPRECVPTELLGKPLVWDALLHSGKFGMPITALIRNLGKMTEVGLLKPLSEASKFVCARLADVEGLKHGRVHPLRVLAALRTYSSGHGFKGKLSWTPVQDIVDALDAAFYLSFQAVEPTNKRFLVGVDVSGSMSHGAVAGLEGVSPCEAAACVALVLKATEPNCELVAFDDVSKELRIGRKTRLDDATEIVRNLVHGGTDCNVPVAHALANKYDVDCFVVVTDDQTWAGGTHPVAGLKQYRNKRVADAKLVSACLVASGGSIADPRDAGMLATVGLSPEVPEVIRRFALGEI